MSIDKIIELLNEKIEKAKLKQGRVIIFGLTMKKSIVIQ